MRAFLCGFLGATASLFAKVAFDNDSYIPRSVGEYCANSLPHLLAPLFDTGWSFCNIMEIATRGISVLIMLACNALMLGSFLQAMDESGSVAGTALATAANFTVSAVYGFCLWGDEFSLQWLFGFSLVILGVVLLSTMSDKEKRS